MKRPITDIFDQDKNADSFKIEIDRYFYNFELKATEGQTNLWSVFITYKRKKEEVKGTSWLIEQPNFLLLISKSQSDIFNMYERAFNQLFPNISQFYLTKNEFFEILRKFESKYQYELTSSYYTLKRSKSTGEKDKRKTTITYTSKTDLVEVFNEADLSKMWISSIRINGSKHRSDGFLELIQFGIANNTKISIKRGYSLDMLEFFRNEIETIARKRYNLLKNRSRSKTSEHQIKPLFLEFSENAFESKDKISEFLDVLAKYENCQYSVIHSGNPHLFMTISDVKDRSTLNIKSVGLNIAVIIPQIRTSASSLVRFISFIIKNYGECKISEEFSGLDK